MTAIIEPPVLPEPVPKNPRDRYSTYTKIWLALTAAGVITEAIALRQDRLTNDRVKRTLSSNARSLFAWDSITGQALHVPYGRLRRTALICLLAWLPEHLRRNGTDGQLKV